MHYFNVNKHEPTGKFRAYINTDREKYDDTCIGYFFTETEAWEAAFNYRRPVMSCFPGYNRNFTKIVDIELYKTYFNVTIMGERTVRDGTFHAQHSEFYVIWNNRQFWCKEKTLQEFFASVQK